MEKEKVQERWRILAPIEMELSLRIHNYCMRFKDNPKGFKREVVSAMIQEHQEVLKKMWVIYRKHRLHIVDDEEYLYRIFGDKYFRLKD